MWPFPDAGWARSSEHEERSRPCRLQCSAGKTLPFFSLLQVGLDTELPEVLPPRSRSIENRYSESSASTSDTRNRTNKGSPRGSTLDVVISRDPERHYRLLLCQRLVLRLVNRIVAKPCRAFDSHRIVLKAHFDVNLIALFPSDWQSLLAGRRTLEEASAIGTITTVSLVVDMFGRPAYLQHAAEGRLLQRQGLRLAEIRNRLGLRRDVVKAALKADRMMEELGLTAPYELLTEPTLMPGRWKQDELGTSSSKACAARK